MKKVEENNLCAVEFIVRNCGAWRFPVPTHIVAPDESYGDCVASASQPYRSGSLVKGYGTVSCLSPHNSILIHVTITNVTRQIEYTGSSYYADYRCPTQSMTCSSSNKPASAPFFSGESYHTNVSVTYGDGSNDYAQSGNVTIP